MNLATLASNVCAKIGKTDSDSIAACKQFISSRYEMLYDACVWKESKAYLDEGMQLQTNVNGYSSPPGSVTVDFAVHQIWPQQVGAIISASMNGELLFPGQGFAVMGNNPTDFKNRGNASLFITEGTSGIGWQLPNDSVNMGDRLIFKTSNTADVGAKVVIRGRRIVTINSVKQLSRLVQEETVTLAGPLSSVTTSGTYGVVEQLTKPITVGEIIVTSQFYSPNFEEWGPTETKSRRVVTRLVRLPIYTTAPLLAYCYYKKALVPMVNDGDESLIFGADNCLLAWGMADMLERGRQYGKAAIKQQEAAALQAEMIALQVAESAEIMQIQPDCPVEAGSAEDFGWSTIYPTGGGI